MAANAHRCDSLLADIEEEDQSVGATGSADPAPAAATLVDEGFIVVPWSADVMD